MGRYNIDFRLSDEANTLKLAIDQTDDWVVVTDVEGTIIYANQGVEKLSGYKKEMILGNKPSIFKSHLVPESHYKKLWETILNGQVYSNVIMNRHKNGSLYYIACAITPVRDETGITKYFISAGRKISGNSSLSNQIYDVVHYDTLTGLLNRNAFIEEVSQSKQYQDSLAIVAITINKLGLINSRYGFLIGDKVIKKVGLKIREVVDISCVVSRVEGKVFGVLISNFENPTSIVQLIKKIERATAKPIKILDEEIYVSLTFGISTYPSDKIAEIDVPADALLTRAQLALSKAKNSNSLQSYEFYTYSMNKQVNMQMHMENEIFTAFKNDEFISYFQPLINLESGELSGLEALMRREKPTGEIASPFEFITFLETTGLIVDVGFSLIEKICKQMKYWIDEYGFSLPVSINLSPVQFKDALFCEKMMEITAKCGIPPKLITFEITESMLIEDVGRTVCIVERLRSQGFSISIDDFGTGYSSLSYIQRFEVNSIKIDMSFIRNIVDNSADQTIVKAITMMATGLDLYTVAEGVETKEQLELIKGLGVDVGQGYYWDKPLSAYEITQKYFTNHKS